MCDGECQALKQSAQCQHKNSSMAGQCGTPPSDNENGTSTKKRTNIREEDENDTYSRRMGVSEREREGGERERERELRGRLTSLLANNFFEANTLHGEFNKAILSATNFAKDE